MRYFWVRGAFEIWASFVLDPYRTTLPPRCPASAYLVSLLAGDATPWMGRHYNLVDGRPPYLFTVLHCPWVVSCLLVGQCTSIKNKCIAHGISLSVDEEVLQKESLAERCRKPYRLPVCRHDNSADVDAFFRRALNQFSCILTLEWNVCRNFTSLPQVYLQIAISASVLFI